MSEKNAPEHHRETDREGEQGLVATCDCAFHRGHRGLETNHIFSKPPATYIPAINNCTSRTTVTPGGRGLVSPRGESDDPLRVFLSPSYSRRVARKTNGRGFMYIAANNGG